MRRCRDDDLVLYRRCRRRRRRGVGRGQLRGIGPREQQRHRDDQGYRRDDRGDTDELRRVVKALWNLLPEDSEARKRGFDSGVR